MLACRLVLSFAESNNRINGLSSVDDDEQVLNGTEVEVGMEVEYALIRNSIYAPLIP